MKTIYKIKLSVATLMVALGLSACTDWLTIDPVNGVIAEEYWQSEADLKSGVMGIYASMLGNNASGSNSVAELLFYWGEVRADMVANGNLILNDFNLIYNGDLNSNNGLVKWNSIYRTINYCNIILEKAPEVKRVDAALTDARMNEYRAEALTIRAMMYLLLNKVYREVPLITEATTADNQTLQRAKVLEQSELWNQIEADLLEAQKYAVESYGTTSAEDKGRVTKYTIASLMADFYLWRSEPGDAAKAQAACDIVIKSGRFNLVKGDENWLNTLYYNGNSLEGVFELQFSADILNPYFNLFATNNYLRANVDVVESFFPDDPMVDADSADVRADRGSYRSALNYALWKYIGVNRYASKTATTAYSNFIVYRYADILLMKAEALALQVEDQPELAAESLALIHKIRNRARASVLTSEGAPDTKEGLINYVLNERAREFAFEGKRWFDLLRIAKRDGYKKKNILVDMLTLSAPATRLLSIQAKMQDPNYHYMPIPQSDIDAGYPYLIQNPFYQK
ncbi:putative outer membrane starch-binding protein [Breznakibacter xylanolyticus]|uniref:Putative outer membrane starch-binding protein n=1 Tax=Breznakibacter xylanolyticus TaxID=990 RepID=A0A2W7NEL1_9BACT|nr:RagB/SusD family nutrient uptake outer membrane protein [Breznakibacter xylanolyticus]PZX18628.1 putative outer membrane starch-binding protein [Breznakibacter xylanolyticus]